MSKNIVETIKGEKLPSESCRKFEGGYYKIGDPRVKGSGDCYKVGDRYYRDDTGYIVFDEYKGKYVTNGESIIRGVIGIDKKTGDFEFGYFSKNALYNVKVTTKNGKTYDVINSSVFRNQRQYRYHLSKDRYYFRNSQPAISFVQCPELSREEKYSLDYNCDNSMSKYVSLYNSTDIKLSAESVKYSKLIDGLSFGLEFETTYGKLPNRISRSLGLIPLRDGSINGLEYATIPYAGAKGLEAIKLACRALDTYTTYDEDCSLHLHVGGIPRNKEVLLAMFKVLCTIQEEMYGLFPIYKQYNFGVKRKNYTRPLPIIDTFAKMDNVITSENIDDNFGRLFSFLSSGITFNHYNNSLDNVENHPSDPRGRSKWNIRSRYYWVNMIPIIFGNKQTVEFRIHTPTTDYNKVLAYVFLCGAIVKYTKDNYRDILRGNMIGNLSDIVQSAYRESDDSNLQRNLIYYISNRRDHTYYQNSKGNIRGNEKELRLGKFLPDVNGKDSSESSSRFIVNYLNTRLRDGIRERGGRPGNINPGI